MVELHYLHACRKKCLSAERLPPSLFTNSKKRFPYDAAQRKDAKLCQSFILLITDNNEHAKFKEEKESSIAR